MDSYGENIYHEKLFHYRCGQAQKFKPGFLLLQRETTGDIDIINKYKEEFLEIKASGGVRDIEMVNNLLDRGVTRLGMSNIDCLKGSKE